MQVVTADGHRYRMPRDLHGLCAVDASGLTIGRFHDSCWFGRRDGVHWQGWQFPVSYGGSLAILHTPDGRPLTTVGSNCN